MHSYITLTACFCLLGFQMSGLHTHIDEHGYDGTIQGTHMHVHSHQGDTAAHGDKDILGGDIHLDDHDYAGDKDVFLFDLGLSASKVLDFFILFSLSLFIAVKSICNYSPIYLDPHPDRHREHRWPQLRAPPSTS